MNTTRLLIGLSIVMFVASVGVGVNAQAVEPDRISFYNDPGDSKLESHVDYADGDSARIRYGACAPGAVIEETLNTYTARFTVEGCGADIHQHLNLRWVGGCTFDMEHDPDARIVTYGDYGQVTITGHYPQGEMTLAIPTGTVSMTAVMSHTFGAELWTGNIEYLFNSLQGCVDAPATPTPTETPVMVDTATATPTLTQAPTETPTDGLSTPTLETPTPTPTEIIVIDEPTATPTPTEVNSGQQPTGEQPVAEPGRMVYLPLVSR